MMLTINTVLDDFERLGWQGNDPMAQMLRLWRQDPAALGELAMAFLERSLESSTFIDAALELMDDETYFEVMRRAWQMAGLEPLYPALPSMLESAALQYPQVFSGDWERLLLASRTGLGEVTLNINGAWRALDCTTAQDWHRRLLAGISKGEVDRECAEALLYCRQPALVLDVWQKVFCNQPGEREGKWWLMSAGYDMEHGVLRPLHSDFPLHIDFGPKQRKKMSSDMAAWRREIRLGHPTWRAGVSAKAQARIGGLLRHTCGLCHAPLHRLLSLKQPSLAGIACETPIEFGTCMSCLGLESDGPLFYRHDADGVPHAHPTQELVVALQPEFPAEALLEEDVHLFTTSARWALQDWGESNSRQNLHRVGGAPSWVQSAHYAECPDCNRRMNFVMQLDSELPCIDGGDWLWGSGGCNYTFWCGACRVSAHLWQCT